MIHLELVNKRTFRTVAEMKLPPEQNKLVAPNVVSLAQAWLEYDTARPYAICEGDEVVGFMMLDWDEGERVVDVWRFMIAHEHQHKGYGRQAMLKAIDMIREADCFDMIQLDYVEGNTAARELYYSLGFRETGEIDDGEVIMTLPLTSSPKVGMLTADDDDMDDYEELVESEAAHGTALPAVFADKALFANAVAAEHVKRFVIMGKTIGFAVDSELLLFSDKQSRLPEVKEKLTATQCTASRNTPCAP